MIRRPSKSTPESRRPGVGEPRRQPSCRGLTLSTTGTAGWSPAICRNVVAADDRDPLARSARVDWSRSGPPAQPVRSINVKPPLRIALLGVGRFDAGCRPNSHPGSMSLLCCSLRGRDTEGRVFRHHPGLDYTTSLERVFDDSTIDAVVIATPIETHAAIAPRRCPRGSTCSWRSRLRRRLRRRMPSAPSTRARPRALRQPPVSLLIRRSSASGPRQGTP